jgi:thioredoxin-like negative regulator of GroEL
MRWVCAVWAWLAFSGVAHATWLEASTDNFLVYSNGEQDTLVRFTERVEKFDQVLRFMTGVKAPPSPLKVRVYLFGDVTAVQQLHPEHQKNVEGFYTAPLGGGVAIVHRAGRLQALNGETVLYHEYAHHFMMQHSPIAYPVWYQEGFAEYYSTTEFPQNGTVEVGHVATHRTWDLFNEQWIPSAKLMTSTLEPLSAAEQEQFYAQGWLLTHYLLHDDTLKGQLQQYLVSRSLGTAHAEALQKAFGLDDQQMDASLRRYAAQTRVDFTRLPGTLVTTPKVAVRDLPPSVDALLIIDLRTELGVADAERDKLLRAARTTSARFPNDPYAQVVLAAAEARYGEPGHALERLQAVLDKDPNNRRAMLGISSIKLDSSQADDAARLVADRQARTMAVKANRLMPDDPQALLLFYRSFRNEQKGPSQNALEGLTRAYGLLPQNRTIAMALARERIRQHETEQAIMILQPIAYSPHDPKLAKTAQSWIQRAKENKAPESSADDPTPR